jgi:hypothetical protein
MGVATSGLAAEHSLSGISPLAESFVDCSLHSASSAATVDTIRDRLHGVATWFNQAEDCSPKVLHAWNLPTRTTPNQYGAAFGVWRSEPGT